ncbi:hypothetical protein BGX27_003179, partial [Mortierella sp. AM989]
MHDCIVVLPHHLHHPPIGTNFVYKNDYMYNDSGQQSYHGCQRSGKRVRKERSFWETKKSETFGEDPATLAAKTVTILLPNGMPEDAYLITI